MPTFAKKQPQSPHKRPPARHLRPRPIPAELAPDPHAILYLQQTIGNQAVLRKLQGTAGTSLSITPTPGVQVARQTDEELLREAQRELEALLQDEGLKDLLREELHRQGATPTLGSGKGHVPAADAERLLQDIVNKGEPGRANAAKSYLDQLRGIRKRQTDLARKTGKIKYQGAGGPDKNKSDKSSGKPTPKVDTGPKLTQVTPKPKATGAGGLKPTFAKALSGIRAGAARAIKLAGRLTGFVTVLGYLSSALDALDAIEDITALMAHGTTMPKEQAEANKVWRDSDEAKREAEALDEDVSYAALSIIINEAAHSGDDQALLALSGTLIEMRQSLRATAGEFTHLSVQLTEQAKEVQIEIAERLRSIIKPGSMTTVGAGHAIIMADSLKKLGATITSAADNFTVAAKTLTNLADELEPFETAAHNAMWDVRQKQAAKHKQ